MWAQTVQAVADSRVSMDVFWCLQDTAMFFICLHKSACCHSHQDEINLHIWSGLPCSFGSGECFVPTGFLSMTLFLMLSQPPHSGREKSHWGWSQWLLQEDQCISKPVFKTRNLKQHRKTDYFSFTSPLYWICIYYLLSLCFFTVILISCTRSVFCLYLIHIAAFKI